MKQRKRGKSDLIETLVIAIILLIMILIALRIPGKSYEAAPKDFPSYQFIVSKLRSNRGNRVIKPIRPFDLGVVVNYGAPLIPGGVITCRPIIKTTPTKPPMSYMELVCGKDETNLGIREIIWERR